MARWQPHAPERLVAAALDLFEERGYEQTTVIDIAERAGLTKSTFFRHFPDKREVLFGGGTMHALLADGIAAAPAAATPAGAVAHTHDQNNTEAFPQSRRDFTARRRAVIAANPELREREALKGLALAAAMTDALKQRGVPALTAYVTAELGLLALALAYERWSDAPAAEPFAAVARQALTEVQSAAAAVSTPG